MIRRSSCISRWMRRSPIFSTAAPSFSPIVRNVLEDVLTLYEVKRTDDQMAKIKLWTDPVTIEVGDYIGKEYKKVKNENLKLVKIGEGDVVVDQLPSCGVKIDEQGTVWLYCPAASAE